MEAVLNAKLSDKKPHGPSKSKKRSIMAGLRFEKSMQDWIRKGLPKQAKMLNNHWLEYTTSEGTFFAQPDTLVLLDQCVYIFEYKLRHTPRSIQQLYLYESLVKRIWPKYEVRLVECYKFWDIVRYDAPSYMVPVRKQELVPSWWQDKKEGAIALLGSMPHLNLKWR